MRIRANLTEHGPLARRTIGILLLLLSGLPFAAQAQIEGSKRPLVHIRTTQGNMIVALYNETPLHRDNFLAKVRSGQYDSTLFHRMVKDFMVQGGDTASRRATDRSMVVGRSPAGTIPAEIHPELVHLKGTLAAARQDDDANPDRHSNDSQFYFVIGRIWNPADLERYADRRNAQTPTDSMAYTLDQQKAYSRLGGAPHLDGRYTVFGEIVEGVEVLDAINALTCDELDRPRTDVRIWMNVLE